MRRQEINKSMTLTDTRGSKDTYNEAYFYDFASITEFVKYIENNKIQSYYKSSITNSSNFTGTKSFEEALDLLAHGWEDGAKRIDKGLKEKLSTGFATGTRQRSVYDVVGGNASVPRYLQGVPTNMIRQVKKPVKQPIIDIYLNFTFSCDTPQETLINTCIETLQRVVNLENAGTRVNLYAVNISGKGHTAYMVKICLKKSTERLNILKLAFPAAHPSMLRRIHFAFCERNPDMVKNSDFFPGYGHPYRGEENLKTFIEALS